MLCSTLPIHTCLRSPFTTHATPHHPTHPSPPSLTPIPTPHPHSPPQALLDREYRRAKAESAAAKSRDYGADPGSDAESGSGDDDADGEGILGDMGGDDDEGDGGGMKEATYEDFFGPRRRGGAGAGRVGFRGRQQFSHIIAMFVRLRFVL